MAMNARMGCLLYIGIPGMLISTMIELISEGHIIYAFITFGALFLYIGLLINYQKNR